MRTFKIMSALIASACLAACAGQGKAPLEGLTVVGDPVNMSQAPSATAMTVDSNGHVTMTTDAPPAAAPSKGN